MAASALQLGVPVEDGEKAWRWLCRGLAVVGFAFLLATSGVDAPTGYYLLLIGLFFGPEVVAGQIQINRRNDDRK